MKNIAVFQLYFYPDMSAVSQLLGDLLKETSNRNKNIDFTVYCGSSYFSEEQFNRLPDQLGKVKIKRIKTMGLGKRSFLTRLIDYSSYYLAVWFYTIVLRRYDGIICFSTPPLIAFLVSLGLLFRKTPFVYYVQDLYPEILFDMRYIKKPWIIRKMSVLNRTIFRRANGIVSIGEYMTRKIRSHYSVSQSKILEIHNWTNEVHYETPKQENHFTLLYSGNLGLAHDFTLFAPLLEQLNSNSMNNTVRFEFVGGGKGLKTVQKLFSDHPQVISKFRGYTPRSEHSNTLASGNVLIIAQNEETVGDILPSKFYSYLAAGRPILFLGPRLSEIGETIIKHELGVVLEIEEDIPQVLECIQRYQNDIEHYRTTCRKARSLYENEFSFEDSVGKFENMIKELIPV